jgi:hypothetical protein
MDGNGTIPDTIEKALYAEIKIWADRLSVDRSFDITFYKPGNTEGIIGEYQGLYSRGQVNLLRTISKDEGTMIALYGSTMDGNKSLDIILLGGQDLISLTFQALKALVWYQYFRQIEHAFETQIRCLSQNNQVYELAITNAFESMEEVLDALAVQLITTNQELVSLNAKITQKEE